MPARRGVFVIAFARAWLDYFPMPGTDPTLALAPVAFRFRALAALAGRASLGGEREVVLGCYLVARLADDSAPASGRQAVSKDIRASRAAAAKTWLASLTVPPNVRAALLAVADSTAGEDSNGALKVAVERLAEVAKSRLDAAAHAELKRLANRV